MGRAPRGRRSRLHDLVRRLAHFGWSPDPHDAVAGPNVQFASHIALDFSIVLLGYGVLAIWAAQLAWRGHALGVWLKTILLGIADAAFVIALMIPGHVPASKGIWGPLLYVLAVMFSGAGFLRARASRG